MSRLPGVGCITLLTDFGTRDHYVGAVKGVIHSLAPDVKVIDITHEIEPYNVVQAAYVLRQTWPWYPPGTVHLAVVDPGVGSSRRILLGRYAGQFVVAPDNGLITLVHHELPIEELRVVENQRLGLPAISSTFHTRDIMAPIAARLAAGMNVPREVGPVTDRLEVLRIAPAQVDPARGVAGSILCTDRFGNLVTTIRSQDLRCIQRGRPDAKVYLNGKCIGPVRARYADVPAGESVALMGSSDYLEISVNQGNASERLGADPTTRIEIR